jgi:hypothetical protein
VGTPLSFFGNFFSKVLKKIVFVKMKLTLQGLKATQYNGLVVTLVEVDNPKKDRIGVKLPCGKCISVPFSGIDATDLDLETCAICMFPCFPGYSQSTSCKHMFHTTCLHDWRSTAGYDINAPGNRCPTCRAFQGPAGKVVLNASGVFD